MPRRDRNCLTSSGLGATELELALEPVLVAQELRLSRELEVHHEKERAEVESHPS